MNKDLFKVQDFNVFEIQDNETGWSFFLFKSTDESFMTSLKYDPFKINDDNFWLSLIEKIKTILYNRVQFEDKIYETKEELISFIDSNCAKYHPQEKLNNVLEYISGLTKYDGESIDIDVTKDISVTEVWRKYYFDNEKEFLFYLENLKSQGLVSYEKTKGYIERLKITLTGLTALIKINEQKVSRYCFIAMSFDESLRYVYNEAILPALLATGFIAYIVNNEHVASEMTINDAIIAGIKKAHFTIADFTQHKAGVYFEAGYALGRGQKVIYTCRQDEISKAHFDTRNYQHIVWETSADLKQMLIDKINAYVLD